VDPVAFVLSGGANLGAAQAGMLEALLTAGVTPHILVGTSIGSVNAAFLAADPSIERARELSALWRRLSAEEFFPLNPALIGVPKVIHQRRGELWILSPQPLVNNFCAANILACEQLHFRLQHRRHAELGRRITLPLSKDALGETFAPSSALWTKTNSQRSLFTRPSIRPSRVQSFA